MTTLDGGAGMKWLSVSETMPTTQPIAANPMNSCQRLKRGMAPGDPYCRVRATPNTSHPIRRAAQPDVHGRSTILRGRLCDTGRHSVALKFWYIPSCQHGKTMARLSRH